MSRQLLWKFDRILSACALPVALSKEERRMPKYPRCGQVRAAVTGLLVVMLAVGCEAGIALNAVRSKGTPGALNTKATTREGTDVAIKGISEPCHGPFFFVKNR
jgi:hypothetical protein